MISKVKNLNKYTKLTIIAIILAIIVRFYLISIYSVSGDACWHFSVSKFMGDNTQIPLSEPLGRDEPFWAPPLFHIVASVFYKLFGSIGLKLIAPLFGSLALIMSYLILKRFINEKALFYAILFIAFIPISIDHSVLGYVESMLTFFVLLSIYFALDNKFIAASIATGLAILTKYNGIFVVPVLLYIAYKYGNRKRFIKNFLIITIIPGIVGIPWFIRNWILLGNPVWPFLNFIFKGFEKQSYSAFDLSGLFSISTYIKTYLGFFGVPNGDYQTFSLINLPYMEILLAIFLIGTIIFVIPFLFGFKKNKGSDIFYILFGSFAVLFLLFVTNVGSVPRILLLALISLGFFYGVGTSNIIEKHKKLEKVVLVTAILIAFGFVMVESAKFTIASNSWNFYQEDFNWVKATTQKNDIFLVGGQCIPYHIDRTSLFPSEISTGNYDYIWINQNFWLDKRSILTEEYLPEIESKNKELMYENKDTNTKIYRVIQ
jgi:4-amino-4-deoxy-L-arabinose transferase-like glycosyltransferase